MSYKVLVCLLPFVVLACAQVEQKKCQCAEPKETDDEKLCNNQFILKLRILKKTVVSLDYQVQYEIEPVQIYKQNAEYDAFNPEKKPIKLYTDSDQCGVNLTDYEGKDYLLSGYYSDDKRPTIDMCSGFVYKWEEVPADLQTKLSDMGKLQCPKSP